MTDFQFSESDDDDMKYSVILKVDSSAVKNVNFAQLVDFVKTNKHGYEVITDKCVPYYDYEKMYDSKKETKANRKTDFTMAMNTIKNAYSSKYPDVKIYAFEASGCDLKQRWKNSFHFRLRGCGYLNQGSDCILLDGFDKSVYKNKGKRQLIRMPFCSKEGEDRPFKPVKKTDEFNEKWLIQNIETETFECEVRAEVVERIVRTKTEITRFYTAIEIEALFDCINYEDTEYDFKEWTRIIWGLRNMADDYKIDLRPLAHDFSKGSKCGNKYDEAHTNKIYDSNDSRPSTNPIGIGTFLKMAKEINPKLFMEWRKGPPVPVVKVPQSDMLPDHDDEDEDDEDDDVDDVANGVNNDVEASKKLYKLYPHWKFCLETLYVFDFDSGLWTCSKSIHRNIAKLYAEDLRIIVTLLDGNQILSTESYGSSLRKIDTVIELIKGECVDNQWLIRSELSSLGKLLFNNGYLDLKNGLKFYDKAIHKFNPDIVFMERILKDFNHFNEEQMLYVESIKNRFFYNVLGKELGDYYLLHLSRGLMGDMMKKIIFSLGTTDCGKSVLTFALKKSMEGYFGDFNAENLIYNKNSSDEAAKLRWALLLRYKRIIVSNEMKSNEMINGNMIKKISSGGDGLTGRPHCGNETAFTPHFAVVAMANDLNKISPYDKAVDNRVKIISYKKQFVDNPVDCEYELQKDNNITDEINKIEFQNAFLMMMITRYEEFKKDGDIIEPLEVSNGKKEWIEETGDVIDTFLQDFEITNNVDDFVTSDHITNWIQNKKLGITMMKFGLELKKYCNSKKHINVDNKKKKVNRRSVQVWCGINSNLDDVPQ